MFAADTADADSSLQIPAFGGAQFAVYLNGQRLPSSSQDVARLLVAGNNTVLVQVQSHRGDAGSIGLNLWHNSPLTHTAWYFHGGLEGLDETPIIGRVTNWSDFLASSRGRRVSQLIRMWSRRSGPRCRRFGNAHLHIITRRG